MRSFLLEDTPWNLFLAIIPAICAYGLSYGIRHLTLERRRVPWLAWLPVAIVWLLFLPNTCYLLTEWRHFLWDERLPVWTDIHGPTPHYFQLALWSLFFLIYSGCGVLLFTLSVRPISNLLLRMGVARWPLAVPFFLLTAFGVYLGLVLRFNSWDVWTDAQTVLGTAWHSVQDSRVQTAVTFFAGVLWAIYQITDIWVEGFKQRLRDLRLLKASGS